MASAVGSEMMSKVHKEEEEHGIKIMYKRMYTYIIVPFTDLIYRLETYNISSIFVINATT